jgi:hypothetical protein
MFRCILPSFLLAKFILTNHLKWATASVTEYSLGDQIKKVGGGGVRRRDDKCKRSGFVIVRGPERNVGRDTGSDLLRAQSGLSGVFFGGGGHYC